METDPTKRILRESGTESESDGSGSVSENSAESNKLTFEQFKLESKKLRDFAESIVDKMPGKKFDFKNAESWKVLAEILAEFEKQYNLEGKNAQKEFKDLPGEESFTKPFEVMRVWMREHMLGGSLVHEKEADMQVAVLNHGLFNSLVKEGVLKEEDKESFLAMMPEYWHREHVWTINTENVSDEVVQKTYAEKIALYDNIAEKAGGSELIDVVMKKQARWLNNLYYQTVEDKDNDYSDWSEGEEREMPSEELIEVFKGKGVRGGGLQYAHYALYYFNDLKKESVKPVLVSL